MKKKTTKARRERATKKIRAKVKAKLLETKSPEHTLGYLKPEVVAEPISIPIEFSEAGPKNVTPPAPNVQVFENPATWKMGEPVEVSQPKRPVRGRVAEPPNGEQRMGHLYVALDRGEKRATGQWFPFELCRRPKA